MSLSPSDRARKILSYSPVYLDTETTGLGGIDEICEVSIIDYNGSVLLDTLVKPSIPIPASVSSIHGITDEMVSSVPEFPEILPQLLDVLEDRVLVVYNLEFDIRMLRQSAAVHGLEFSHPGSMSYCARELYAEFWGEWHPFYENYKWQRLGDAMQQQGIRYDGKLHRAVADTQVTRLLMLKMARGLV
jgi:DNA polymerase III epsilon subunit-like protein